MLTGYQKYQLEWMIEHGYSLEDLIKELNEYKQYANAEDVEDLFDTWEDEQGFVGAEIWACEDEWKENDQPIGESNVCPVCGEPLEDYDTFEMYSENAGYFKWRCGNCGAYGEENHQLKFVGHDNIFDKDNNELEEIL